MEYNFDPQRNYQQFKIRAFRFFNDYDQVYIHCEVLACHKYSSNSRWINKLAQKHRRQGPNKQLSLTNTATTLEKFECNMISSLTRSQRRSKLIQIFLNNFDRCTQSCLGSKRRRRDVTRDETEHEESTTKVTLTRGPLIIQQEEEPAGKFTYNVKR